MSRCGTVSALLFTTLGGRTSTAACLPTAVRSSVNRSNEGFSPLIPMNWESDIQAKYAGRVATLSRVPEQHVILGHGHERVFPLPVNPVITVFLSKTYTAPVAAVRLRSADGTTTHDLEPVRSQTSGGIVVLSVAPKEFLPPGSQWLLEVDEEGVSANYWDESMVEIPTVWRTPVVIGAIADDQPPTVPATLEYVVQRSYGLLCGPGDYVEIDVREVVDDQTPPDLLAFSVRVAHPEPDGIDRVPILHRASGGILRIGDCSCERPMVSLPETVPDSLRFELVVHDLAGNRTGAVQVARAASRRIVKP